MRMPKIRAFVPERASFMGLHRRTRISGRRKLSALHLRRPPHFRQGPGQALRQRRGCIVKMIIAAIKPYKLDEVREALTAMGSGA